MKFLIKNRRQILLLAAICLFFWLAYSHRSELSQVKTILARGEWGMFLLALFLQLLFFIWQSDIYYHILNVWLPVSFRNILAVTLSSNSINKLLPSGGMSGLVLFMAQAQDNGVNKGASFLANILFYAVDYLSFLLLVWCGMVYYSHTAEPKPLIRVAVILFSVAVLVVCLALAFLFRHVQRLWPWVEKLCGLIPFHREFFKSRAPRLAGMAQLIRSGAGRMGQALFPALLSALLMQLTDVAILFLCFKTVGYEVNPGMLIAGFGLATVLAMVSMVPQGIGIYESAMTWIYVQMGIPFNIAITVSVLYRAVTFWFAIVPGLFTMRKKENKDV